MAAFEISWVQLPCHIEKTQSHCTGCPVIGEFVPGNIN